LQEINARGPIFHLWAQRLISAPFSHTLLTINHEAEIVAAARSFGLIEEWPIGDEPW